MEKTYSQEDLQYILDLYNSPNLSGYAIAMADQLFHEFANGTANIAESAYDDFQTILDTFSPSNMSDDNDETIDYDARSQAEYRFNQQRQLSDIANQNNREGPTDTPVEQNEIVDEDQPQVEEFVDENIDAPAEHDEDQPQVDEQLDEPIDTPIDEVIDQKPTPQDENQAVQIYSNEDLQEILRLYQDDATHDDAIAIATQFLEDFINGHADVDDDALESLQQIVNTFGAERDENGNLIYNDLGNRAINRMQQIGISLENAIHSDRINSMTSDENQIRFNLIRLNIYKDMGLVDASIDPSNMTPQQVVEAIDSVNLSDTQRVEFSNRFYDTVVNDPQLFEITPPQILADAYTFTKEQLLQKPNDEALSRRFETVARRIDSLITDLPQRVNYCYSDPSNIADIYDGYESMCNVRKPDLVVKDSDNEPTKQYKERMNTAIDEAMAQLEEVVKTYSEMWNMQNLRPEDAEKLDARWREISEKLKGVELSDEMLEILAKYQFLDENGKPIPQFLDENKNPQVNYQPGYTLDPNGRLYRIISLAKTDVTMRNVGDLDTAVQDMDLESELSDRIPWKMAEISVIDQAVQGVGQNPRRMLNEQEVNDIWDNINANGGQISDTGYQAALDAQVNQAAGWAGMMAKKVGADKPIVMRPFESIEDVDKLASTRTEKVGAKGRKKKIGLFKRIIKHFAVAAGVSTGLSIIGHATGFAFAGAVIGTTLGIGNMVIQGFKWRKAQKAAGKPHGIKAFFSDKKNWGPAVASGLGVAAVISMASGAPELSAAFGIGAIAIGGGSAAKATYDDAIAAGYTKGQAVAAAVSVIGASVVGGVVGAPYGETPPYGVGTFGIYEPRQERESGGLFKRMRKRLGALADRARGLISRNDENNDDQRGDDKPHDDDDRPHDDDDRPHNDDDRPHDDDDRPHTNDTGRDGAGNSRPQAKKRRGFFGRCKDFTYKIMRSVYHGLQKIQKGVNKMKDEHMQSENERKAAEQAAEEARRLAAQKAAEERAMSAVDHALGVHGKLKDVDMASLAQSLLKAAQALASTDENAQRQRGNRLLDVETDLAEQDLRNEAARRNAIAEADNLIALAKKMIFEGNGDPKTLLSALEDLQRAKDIMELGDAKRAVKTQEIRDTGAEEHAQSEVQQDVIHATGRGQVRKIDAESDRDVQGVQDTAAEEHAQSGVQQDVIHATGRGQVRKVDAESDRDVQGVQDTAAEEHAKSEVNIETTRAEGARTTRHIKDESAEEHATSLRDRIRRFLFPSKADVELEEFKNKIAELKGERKDRAAKYKAAIKGLKMSKKAFEAGIEALEEQMRQEKFTEEEIAQVREAVIEKTAAYGA